MLRSTSSTRARVDEDRLQAGDLGVVEVGPAEVLEPPRRRPGRARRRRRDERRELALAQVVTDRLAGDGDVPEHPEDVVAQLEGLAERQPERAERVGELFEAAGERGAEMQRPLDGVLPRLVPLDPRRLHRVAAAAGRALEVEVLADAELDAQLVEDGPGDLGCRAEQDVGVHEGEVADEDRRALAVPAGLAAPPLDVVAGHEAAMDRRETSTQVRTVHDVVVHERERVQQLERGAGVDDDRVVVRAARADERPVTERGPQPLPARPYEVAQRDERLREVGVDRAPPCELVVEQRLRCAPRPGSRPRPGSAG